jgi:hypothetical protein
MVPRTSDPGMPVAEAEGTAVRGAGPEDDVASAAGASPPPQAARRMPARRVRGVLKGRDMMRLR